MMSDFPLPNSISSVLNSGRSDLRLTPALRAKRCATWTALNLLAMTMIVVIVTTGCGTTTNRTATEQLLLSDAVDRAISKIDFTHLAGEKVYLDTVYLHSVKGVGFVNSEYVISSLRQQLTAARCLIQDTREDAEIVVEPRIGALGTDGHEVVYGIQQSGAVNSAAQALSNVPVASIPEISIGKNNAQSGIAKIIVYAYDRDSREPVWQSGIARAESTSKDTWFLGAGPFQKGSIYKGVRFAGNKYEQIDSPLPIFHPRKEQIVLPDTVPFDSAYAFPEDMGQSDLEIVPSTKSDPATVTDGDPRLIDDRKVGQTSYNDAVGTDP